MMCSSTGSVSREGTGRSVRGSGDRWSHGGVTGVNCWENVRKNVRLCQESGNLVTGNIECGLLRRIVNELISGPGETKIGPGMYNWRHE